MRTTEPERLERLRAQLRGEPVSKKSASMTPSSRGANLLLGVLLHGAARLEAGLTPTDLEARLAGPVRELLSEEEVRDFGRVYAEEEAARSKVFPDVFVGRPLPQGYTLDNLVEDLPALREEILAQPNVKVIDLDAPGGEGGAESEEFARATAAYGYGATVITSSAHAQTAQSAQAVPKVMAKVWLDRFHMHTGSDEIGDEEIYWATAGAADGGARQTMTTRVHTGVNSGETHRIDPNSVVYHGAADKVVTFHVECWEEDHSRPSELQATLEKISKMAWEVSEALGEFPAGTHLEATANFAALISGVANLIKLIVSWFEDDLVDQRTFLFDRPALEAIAAKPHQENSWYFNGGGFLNNGLLSLSVRSSVRKLPTISVRAHNGQSWTTVAQHPGTTPSAPAIAGFNNHLYSAVQGFNNRVYIFRFDGTSWSSHGVVRYNEILSAPALAAHGGKLYLAHRTLDNKILVTASPDGITWPTPPVTLPGLTQDGPALHAKHSELYCAFRGVNNDRLYSCVLRGGTWQRALNPHPDIRTHYGPALTMIGSSPQMAHTGTNGATFIDYAVDVNTWKREGSIGGQTAAGPALAVRNLTVYCAVLGLDGKIWLQSRTAGTHGWNGFQPIPDTANAVSAPALATHGNTLYAAYATATAGI
ncbi:hypothetical protein [Streptomyces lydicus]|uniref:hypothetical protein n=1 Tax=Streptomyces lydicus TaxID=47763 RepID=UPI0010130E1C|nr:hypothetical protein [Streptomyces lydicus]MCZ1005475.1 hypothetical protein [Streptomyces lydicus]